MPDVASATGRDGGRRARRPPVQHLGEVTKQKQTADNRNDSPAEGPPLHKGPQIGGPTSFLSQTPPFIAPDNHTDDVGLNQVAQLQAYATSTNVPSPIGTSRGQSLEAQPGWRRYWTTLTGGQLFQLSRLESLGYVKIGDFCHACRQEPSSFLYRRAYFPTGEREQARCWSCITGECLFMVSYRCHSDEDQEIGKSPLYLIRELARNWKAVKASDLAVVTLTEEAQVDPPARMRTRIVQPTADEARRSTQPHVQLTATQYSEACANELETLFNEPVTDSSSHSINDYPLPARGDFY